jgi:hypothetical protein
MLTDGWNQLLYDNFEIIPELLNKNNTEYNEGLYGNGNACNLITDTLKKISIKLLFVYSNHITSRHEYIIPYLLETIAGFKVKLTSSQEEYIAAPYKLNYSNQSLTQNEIMVSRSGLLELTMPVICNASIEKEKPGTPFYLEGNGIAKEIFDPFSAAFYLLTRYEEYFPFEADIYGRFEAASSILYQHGLLEEPLVNKWALALKKQIQQYYPQLENSDAKAVELVSIDVDQAFAFKHRGFKRNLFSFAKNLLGFKTTFISSQLKTIVLKEKDPFDTYGYLESLRSIYDPQMIFFFNLGSYSSYDKNLDIRNKAFRNLLRQIKQFAKIGIHPSYFSSEDPEKLHLEKKALEEAIGETVIKSRQHFLRLFFPHTYRELLHAGVREDYSMGFASHPGFRAGCCTPFYWFDLQKNERTNLLVYPVTYMDGALAEDLKLSSEQALEKIKSLAATVKKYNGYLVSIWHNHTVNDHFSWKGWKSVFEKSINLLNEN